MDSIINVLNTNKYIYAMMMILMNIGSRYIEIDLEDSHKKFLSSKIIRRLLIFTVAFIATRDVVASLIITCCFIILVLNLFNTKSQYCIIPKNKQCIDTITPEEIKNAYITLKKAGKIK
tara:strand:- start:282 stop:638 length:357 start_codon:yes stop_codon:yes gene_type:complete